MLESMLSEGMGLAIEGLAVAQVVETDGNVVVVRDAAATRTYRCAVLQNAFSAGFQYEIGDTVVTAALSLPDTDAVILGRLANAAVVGLPAVTPPSAAVADSIVLEAKREITLRVGDGSITIRADGKILIKGKDLVSHAQRVNRIRGGSVAIN